MTTTIQVNSPILTLGSQGSAVEKLQKLLNQRVAAYLTIDGIFGSKTEAAVKTAQTIFFLEIDGIVGPNTWTVLDTNEPIGMPALSRGSEGELVARVQEVLQHGSYYTGNIDGQFGSKTEAAVTAFQKDKNLSVDRPGVINQKTWAALVGVAAFFALD